MNSWLILAYLALVAVAVILCFIPRKKKTVRGRDSLQEEAYFGTGVRIIQLLAVVCIVPGAVLLRLYDKISADAVMVVLGTVVGYVLSNIKEFKSGGSKQQ